MGVEALLLTFTVGAALLALWVDARFPRLAPSDVWRALVRLVLVLAVAQLMPPAATLAIGAGAPPASAMVGVALPALVALFLAMLWLLRTLQSTFAGAR